MSIYVDSPFILPVRFMSLFATCDSQLAKSPKKSFCYVNPKNCIFIEKKKTKEKEDTVRILNNSFFLLNEWMSSCSFFLNVSV